MSTASSQVIKVGVIGATGYTGHELLRILFRHPAVEISFLSSESFKGKSLCQLFPEFNDKEVFIDLDEASSRDNVDLVFFTTPNNLAVNKAKYFLDKGISVIDFSADFRLKTNDDYKNYYDFEHKDLDLLKSACYGLVEIKRHEIKGLKKPFLIANPGCYTTAANLALAPCMNSNLFDLRSIIIDAKSGTSGAGKKFNEENQFKENFKAYNIAGKHRHTPEINMVLSEIASKEIKVSFTPHLLPMYRGLQATCYINTKADFDIKEFYNSYKEFYEESEFVNVLDLGVLPETQLAYENNHCFIGMDFDKQTNRLIICSCIDNLVKGAAGQAVQNMNIAFCFDENAGLN
jgi:N-acetyl-gamma-glutamyl-phosphate reductase